MNTTSWINRPIRVCPVSWCRCPHRDASEDGRCFDCQRRPANAERHGSTRVTLHGDVWNGPWGTCYLTHAVEPEDRAQHLADMRAAKAAAKALSRDELVAWLRSTGCDVFGCDKVGSLRVTAINRQMDLWWPRQFTARERAA